MKDLGQGQSHEGNRGRPAQARSLRPMPMHSDAEGKESDPREQQPLPSDQADKTTGEQRLLRVARERFITPGVDGSSARAKAGKMSVIKFSHKICRATSGRGQPIMRAMNTVRISEKLQESR